MKRLREDLYKLLICLKWYESLVLNVNVYTKTLRIFGVTGSGLASDLSSNQFSKVTIFAHMCLLHIKETKKSFEVTLKKSVNLLKKLVSFSVC